MSGRITYRLQNLPLTSRVGCISLLSGLLMAGAGMAQHQSYNIPSAVPQTEVQRLEAQRRAIYQRMLTQPKDLNLAFGYATLSSRLGDLEAAASVYEGMLLKVDAPRVRLDLAATYYRLGAMAPARENFLRVRSQPGTPPEVIARIDAYLGAIERQRTQGDGFAGRLNFGMRWQSNANTSPDVAFIPSYGRDFFIGGEADTSALLGAQMRWRKSMGTEGHSFEVSLAGNVAEFGNLDRLSNRSIELRAGPDFALPQMGGIRNARLALSASLARSWLGGESYMSGAGLLAHLRMSLDRRSNLSFTAEWRDEDLLASSLRPRADEQDGTRTKVSALWSRQLSERWQVLAGLSQEWRRASVASHSHDETTLRLGANYRHKPLWGEGRQPWVLGLSTSVSRRVNGAPNPGIDRFNAQRGNDFNIQAVENIPLGKNFGLQLILGYRSVTSNYEIREFDDRYVGFTLTRSF